MPRESGTIIAVSRIIESLLMLVGLSCNLVVLISFLRCTYLIKSESNMLLLILSICDMVHLAVSVPSGVLLQYGLPHNLYGCLVLLSSISLPSQLSIRLAEASTLFSIAVTSFLSLRCPISYARHVTRRKVVLFTLVQMFISGVLDFIPFFGWRRPWNYDRPLCTFQKVQYFTYRVYVVFMGTVVTRFSIMTAIYIYIFYIVVKQTRSIADISTDTRVIAEKTRLHNNMVVARRFSLIIAVFAICMTPIDLINAVELWTGAVCFDCKRAVAWLITIHGCLAPFLYAYNSPSLRYCMLKTIRCTEIQKSEVVSTIFTTIS